MNKVKKIQWVNQITSILLIITIAFAGFEIPPLLSEEDYSQTIHEAKALYLSGKYLESLQILKKLKSQLEKLPLDEVIADTLATCHFYLGKNYLALNNRISAKEAFKRVLKYRADFFDSLKNETAEVLQLIKESQEEYYKEPLAEEPKQTYSTKIQEGENLYQKGAFEQAIQTFREAISMIEATNVEEQEKGQLLAKCHYFVGMSLIGLGERFSAKEEFKKMFHYQPNFYIDPTVYPKEVVDLINSAKSEVEKSKMEVQREKMSKIVSKPESEPSKNQTALQYILLGAGVAVGAIMIASLLKKKIEEKAIDLSGTWKGVAIYRGGMASITITLVQNGKSISGKYFSDNGRYGNISGTVNDSQVSGNVKFLDWCDGTAYFSGTITYNGTKLSGNGSVQDCSGNFSFTFELYKQ